jgi:predicted secreted protein
MKKTLIILALLAIVTSCETEEPVRNVIVKEKGEFFHIEMESNWSTGFHWSWINRESIRVADTTDLEYIIDDPDLEGSQGTEIWTFVAKLPGEESLLFAYQPPGGAGITTEDTMEFRVIVIDSTFNTSDADK